MGQCHGNLGRAAVELAQEWRTYRILHSLKAVLLVCDSVQTFLISGSGDVIEPDGPIAAIGSGGPYASAAAEALYLYTSMSAREIVEEAMDIAAQICIYTNGHLGVEELTAVSPGP